MLTKHYFKHILYHQLKFVETQNDESLL